MNMDSNAIFNRIELSFYSILVSCISRVNRVRDHFVKLLRFYYSPLPYNAETAIQINSDLDERQANNFGKIIIQTIIPFIIWMVLGFAAGFLIGLIKPR